MKKVWVILFCFVLLSSFVLAANEADANSVAADESPELYGGTAEEDAAKLEGIVKNYSPINEDGEIDVGIYNGTKTKAEKKLDEVNLWLKDNASWLRLVFGMVPEISWLFAINLYLWLFFLMVIVLNGHITFSWFESLNHKIDLIFFEGTWANVFGLVVYIGLLLLGVFLTISEWILEAIHYTWTVILPIGLAVAVIVVIIIAVVVFLTGGAILSVLGKIGAGAAKKKAEGIQEKNEENAEVMEKLVNKTLNLNQAS